MKTDEIAFDPGSPPARALALIKDNKPVQAAAIMARHVRRNVATRDERRVAAFCLAATANDYSFKPHKKHAELRLLQRALELDPEHPDHHFNVAAMHLNVAEPEKALPYLQFACSKRPDHVRYRSHLGRALMETGRYGEALPHCADAWESDKSGYETATNLARCLMNMGRPDAAIHLFHKAAAEHNNIRPIVEVFCFSLLTVCENPYQLLDCHKQYGLSIEQVIKPYPGIEPTPRDNRRLRIGFLSSDFRQHSCRYFLLPLVKHLPRDRCEVFCITTHPLVDSITDRFKAVADGWLDVSALHHKQASELISASKIDVLIDCNGLTAGNRNDIMGSKPAPMSCTFLGYPCTTGLSRTDYRIVDNDTDPAPAADTHSTEKPLRLPRLWTFDPPEDLPELGEAPRHKNGYITYGVFNGAGKYSKAALAWWSAILRADRSSRLLVKNAAFKDEAAFNTFLGSMQLLGITPDRIAYLPYAKDVNSGLASYRLIDFQLDTFPYNGTTTTADSILMGVPVITPDSGLHHAARTSLSLNAAVRLTPEELESITPAELRDRALTGQLCDHAAYASSFIDAIESGWDSLHPS